MGAGRIGRVGAACGLAGEARPVDAPIERVQRVQRCGAFRLTRGLIRKPVEEDARAVEVAQVHLGEHLLRNPAIHRYRECLRCEVIERDLLPHGYAKAIGQHRKHLVGRVMIDAHEVGVHVHRAPQNRRDVRRGGQGSPRGLALPDRQLRFLVQGHAVEHDGVAVEKDSRSRRVNPYLPQPEARVQVVNRRIAGENADLHHVKRRQAGAPEVGRADGKRRRDAKHRITAHAAEVDATVEQRLHVRRHKAARVGVQAVARVDLGGP